MSLVKNDTKLPNFPLLVLGCSIIASLAGYFRFYRLPELMAFATDQGRAMLAGRNILLGHWLLDGPLTSIPNFHLGPFYYYLSAIALWFSHFDPIGPAVLVASLGILTAILLFLLISLRWTPTIALTAGLLYALSPLAIAQSRIAIEPGPLPFFTLLWFGATLHWLESGRRRWCWISLALILLAVQLNFSAIVLLPITVAAHYLGNPQIAPARQKLALAIGGLVILALTMQRSISGPLTDPTYLSQNWRDLTTPYSVGIAATLLTLAFIGLESLFHQRSQSKPARLFIIWLILGSLAFLLKHVSGAHSLALLFPLPALLIALGLEPLQRRLPKLSLILLIVLGLFLAGQAQRYVFGNQQLTRLDHQRVAGQIIALANNQPYTFIYRGHLDVYDAADDHYQYLLWLAGHPPADSYRIEPKPEYREKWLLEYGKGEKTIILYYPEYEAERYPAVGRRSRFESVVFEVID